jgi:hypothetical protein
LPFLYGIKFVEAGSVANEAEGVPDASDPATGEDVEGKGRRPMGRSEYEAEVEGIGAEETKSRQTQLDPTQAQMKRRRHAPYSTSLDRRRELRAQASLPSSISYSTAGFFFAKNTSYRQLIQNPSHEVFGY